MRDNNAKKSFFVILFWGSLWGMCEATLGYLVHLATIPAIAGFVMFPIGFYFMTRAYYTTGRAASIFGASAVASLIKLLDLFIPVLPPVYTINPALSILMEGLVVFAVYKVTAKQASPLGFKHVFLVSAGWRVGYLFYAMALFVMGITNGFLGNGMLHIFRFLVLESLVNSALIYFVLGAGARRQEQSAAGNYPTPATLRPAFSVAMLALAIAVQLVLKA